MVSQTIQQQKPTNNHIKKKINELKKRMENWKENWGKPQTPNFLISKTPPQIRIFHFIKNNGAHQYWATNGIVHQQQHKKYVETYPFFLVFSECVINPISYLNIYCVCSTVLLAFNESLLILVLCSWSVNCVLNLLVWVFLFIFFSIWYIFFTYIFI